MTTQPPNKVQARNQSHAFHLAFERSMEQRQGPGAGQFQMLVVPAIVSLAFSIELGLKALCLDQGGAAHGHQLDKLFSQLAAQTRSTLINDVGLDQNAFDAALAKAAHAFVDWRYIYESQ